VPHLGHGLGGVRPAPVLDDAGLGGAPRAPLPQGVLGYGRGGAPLAPLLAGADPGLHLGAGRGGAPRAPLDQLGHRGEARQVPVRQVILHPIPD
jgi:hypothetical protein